MPGWLNIAIPVATTLLGVFAGFGLSQAAERSRLKRSSEALLRLLHGDAAHILDDARRALEGGSLTLREARPDLECWKRCEPQLCLCGRSEDLAAYRRFYDAAREWDRVIRNEALNRDWESCLRDLDAAFAALPAPKNADGSTIPTRDKGQTR